MKKLTAEDVADLGIGTIVGWDADGLMTNVRWQVALLSPSYITDFLVVYYRFLDKKLCSTFCFKEWVVF